MKKSLNILLAMVVFCTGIVFSENRLESISKMRGEIRQNLINAKSLFDVNYSQQIQQLDEMDGRVSYSSSGWPALVIRDGTLLIQPGSESFLAVLRSKDLAVREGMSFESSSVHENSVPFVSGTGMNFEKEYGTQNSIYFLNFNKKTPNFLTGYGSSKIFLMGNSFVSQGRIEV